MPYGAGMSHFVVEDTTTHTTIGHIFVGYEYIVIILLVIIIIMLAYLIFKKPNSEVELAKIEKDVEEIKEIVKDLKKKWEEIE
ncbi:conserved protein of unknown function [Methanocaldococcus lauensis]|uniref:Uncharacterized protein n=1 Tax=Methanocaldococcus lauensis TaxID=2546128 RepID=A0A8D6SYE0_9EURY|nr:hypothetical protein [Methanocaldococcus lauensis]CAB3287236.1 conserved protein of unknown function [Methanocaldococcus lauensis]